MRSRLASRRHGRLLGATLAFRLFGMGSSRPGVERRLGSDSRGFDCWIPTHDALDRCACDSSIFNLNRRMQESFVAGSGIIRDRINGIVLVALQMSWHRPKGKSMCPCTRYYNVARGRNDMLAGTDHARTAHSAVIDFADSLPIGYPFPARISIQDLIIHTYPNAASSRSFSRLSIAHLRPTAFSTSVSPLPASYNSSLTASLALCAASPARLVACVAPSLTASAPFSAL